MKLNIKFLIIIVVVCLTTIGLPVNVMAQGGDPGCDPLDPACPIDGGLSLLIAAGIGLGAKKAYDKKKKQANTDI